MEPTAWCVAGGRACPDVLLESAVHAVDPATGRTHTPPAESTDVYFHLMVHGAPVAQYAGQEFHVGDGANVDVKDGVPVPVAAYAPAGWTAGDASVLLRAAYDAARGTWVASASLKDYYAEAGTHNHVAVIVESKVDSARTMPDSYAVWLGSTAAPFGPDRGQPGDGAGFQYAFRPVLGDPASALQPPATLCGPSAAPPAPPAPRGRPARRPRRRR